HQRIKADHRKEHDRDQHDNHQKARAAPRMLPRKSSRVRNYQFLAGFPGVDCLVLSPVVFKDSSNVAKAGKDENHKDEEAHSDQPVEEIEADRWPDRREIRPKKGEESEVPRLPRRATHYRLRDVRPAKIDEKRIRQKQRQDYEEHDIEKECEKNRPAGHGR